MGEEEDVRWSARSIVHRRSRDDDEGRWSRQLNPDVHSHLRMSRHRDRRHQQSTKQEPLHSFSLLRLFRPPELRVLREDVDDRWPGDRFGIKCPILAVDIDLPDRCRPSGHATLTLAPRQNVTGAIDVANTVLTFRTFS